MIERDMFGDTWKQQPVSCPEVVQLLNANYAGLVYLLNFLLSHTFVSKEQRNYAHVLQERLATGLDISKRIDLARYIKEFSQEMEWMSSVVGFVPKKFRGRGMEFFCYQAAQVAPTLIESSIIDTTIKDEAWIFALKQVHAWMQKILTELEKWKQELGE